MRRIQPVHRYVAAVTAAGLAAVLLVVAPGLARLSGRPLRLALLLGPLVVAAECVRIRIRRRDEEEEVTVSSTFAFALLLTSGGPAAAASLAVGSLLADSLRRKPLKKIAFNVSELVLTSVVSGAALAAMAPGLIGRTSLRTGDLIPISLAALLFFVVNNLLAGTAVALAQRIGVRPFLRRHAVFYASTTGILLTLAPLMVAALNETVGLVPLLVLPIAAVYRASSVLMTKEHEAAHDPLTHLPNRGLFRELAVEAIEDALDGGRELAVMLVDLDRFKEINDTLGHHIGDILLTQIGPRLESVLRGSDTIARLGGDEFAVLVHNVPDEHTAMEVADRMLEALEQPFTLPDVVLDIDASIGIAIMPLHGTDIDILLQRADVAMYLAKETRSGYQVYSAERDPYSAKKLTLLHDMRRGLEQGQLVLHYQPKADLASGAVVGVEALIRWQHPEHGLLPPDTFIPVAERSGLSRPLTLFVLDEALGQVARWRQEGFDLNVAVNLTLRNLHDPSFPLEVSRLLTKHRVDADALQLEITESIVMADPARVLGVLKSLRDMGIELALDDFGTGYSSLAHLKRLPVHELKIDKSFVMNMTSDDSDAVIVRSTIDLARNLRLRTVAEGVEDIASWDQLSALGCDIAQGYYLSRPIPPDQLSAWLLAQRRGEPVPALSPIGRGGARSPSRQGSFHSVQRPIRHDALSPAKPTRLR